MVAEYGEEAEVLQGTVLNGNVNPPLPIIRVLDGNWLVTLDNPTVAFRAAPLLVGKGGPVVSGTLGGPPLTG